MPNVDANKPLLIVITGPTASGKTSLSIQLAQALGTEIISADSRQLFRDLPIGTARPTAEELAAAPHHFIATLALNEYYSAAQFEEDALRLLPEIFSRCQGRAIVCGGSMMYVDALCNGIDQMPTVSDANREYAYKLFEDEGIEGVIRQLQTVDPEYLRTAPDLQNHKRLIHALEISLEAGKPYSSLLTGEKRQRPFHILKFAIDYPRELLFNRINLRVEQMMEQGLLEEARRALPHRNFNSLNTVGYKELFAYFDGVWDLPTAVARIQKNTRVYAKKQLTWLRRDPSVIWLNPATALLPQVLAKITDQNSTNQ
jgi:tRNA dimethylallyltransferase